MESAIACSRLKDSIRYYMVDNTTAYVSYARAGNQLVIFPIAVSFFVATNPTAESEARYEVQPRANPKAAQTSCSRSELSAATRRPRCALDTVTTLWRLMAQMPFIPSASVSTTSDGTPRMVDVMGATVTADTQSRALGRVSTTTGLPLLVLSGLENLYRRTSPRAIVPATTPPAPKPQHLARVADTFDNPGGREPRSRAGAGVLSVREAPHAPGRNGSLAPSWPLRSSLEATLNPTRLG